jgi:hypothetical protein
MRIFRKIEAFVAGRLNLDQWHVSTEGDRFVEKRYNRDTLSWETRPLSPEAEEQAYAMWSIR